MSDARVEALEQVLGVWPGVRPPQGTDAPSLAAEIAWLKASADWQNANGITTGPLGGELARAEAELRKHAPA